MGDLTAQQKETNDQIEAQGPVLREDYSTGTYSQGYVVGVALCRCGAQELGACSGPANEAFRNAVKEAKLTLVQSSEARGCDCAAYQLLSRLTGAGHRVKALALKMYQPVAVAGQDGPPPSPQCPDCRDKLKDMLCNNDEPCGG